MDLTANRKAWRGVIAEYSSWLDLPADASPVTLLEGNTPLIPLPRMAEWIGGGFDLYAKFEGLNPTGSFKDRGMTAAMTVAAHEGAKTVICASTGNTAASAAAYAARAGMACIVLIPAGKVALGKLAASIAYGAQVVQISGSFDDGLRLVREVAERAPIVLVNSVNPARIEGQKTAAFEICDVLGRAPDIHALPVGNAGNITAYWAGYKAYGNGLPVLFGVQAAGAAPIVLDRVIEHPETIATAIRIGNPARWGEAKEALTESGGSIRACSDEQIMEAYHAVARLDGVFCEPSSAAGLAGLKAASKEGLSLEGKTVVCVLTGHGLKDPDSALVGAKSPVEIEPVLHELMKVIGE